MDESVRGTLEFAGVQLAAVVAGLHLYWAIPRLVTAARIDQPIYWDPRPLLFILSGIGILVGLVLVRKQLLSRIRAYSLGIGLMLTYLLGWAYWHLGGHMAVLPWVDDGHGHAHDGNPVVVLAEGGNSLVAEGADLKDASPREDVAVAVKEVIEFPGDGNEIEDRFRLTDDSGVSYHYFGEGAVGDAFGGAFIYTNDKTVSIGLAYRIEDAVTSQPKPEQTLNEFKSHPAVAPLVRGGRTVEYTAKTIPEGGADAMPDLVHDGAVLVGDTAGLVLNNGVHLEGTNMAVESGYHAGNAIISAIANGRTDANALLEYPRNLEESFVVQNLERYEWLMETAVEDKDLLFRDLPRAIADASEEYFSIDRDPKAEHADDAKDRILQTIGGWSGAAKLAWRYRKVMTS